MPTPAADVAHLLRRVGFGGLPAEIAALTPLTWEQIVDRVLDVSSAPPINAGLPNLDRNRGWWERYVDMTQFWTERCRTTNAPLAEKMVLFWHGFLCSAMDKVADHQAMFEQNQVFRVHGLGSFQTLLRETSLQAAMLRYLDNDVNVAGSPNENFARELMELFTVGVGTPSQPTYTENDVRESARAWTGYGVDDNTGRYVFRPEKHDNGAKTFMGTTQNWDGPQIITHLVDGPPRVQTSRFVAAKLWAFLAYPKPDAAIIDTISAAFRDSNMRIDALVRAILLHPEFRSTRARQGLVRSPFEFVVAAMRYTGLPSSVAHPEWTLEPMGQKPFDPPNVSGWRQNEYWISAPAMWAKSNFASHMRWRGIDAGLLANTASLSVDGAVNAALALHGIDRPSATTIAALRNFVDEERSSSRWAEQAGLLFLTLLTPEFQLA